MSASLSVPLELLLRRRGQLLDGVVEGHHLLRHWAGLNPGGRWPGPPATAEPRGQGQAMPRRRWRSHVRLATALLGGLLAAFTMTARARADSDPVTSEVVDITQARRADGQGIRWDYTLLLRESRGTTVQFEKRESVLLGQVNSAPRVTPYRERLGPYAQLRLLLSAETHFPSTGQRSLGETPAPMGLTVLLRFSGRDEAGRPVSFDVRVPLDRGTGRRLTAPPVTPGPSSLPRVPVTTVATILGEWQGHYRSGDGYDLPLRLLIRDGSFEAREGDPVRRRFRGRLDVRDGQVAWSTTSGSGTLTLHEDGGKRVLAGRLVVTLPDRSPINYDVRVEARPQDTAASPGLPPPRPATPPAAPTAPSRGGAPGPGTPATPAGPTIAFRHPPDQQKVTDQAAVVVADISSDRGLTKVAVSVNGVRVHEQGESGTKAVPLSVPINLREGTNVIVVSATEAGGGVRQEVRTVTYQLPAGIRVSYRVHGSAMNLNLKYRSPDGRTEQKKVLLPIDAAWELLFSAREGDTLEVTAQNAGEAGWVTCEIVVEGTAIAARTEEGREPSVTCRGVVTPPR